MIEDRSIPLTWGAFLATSWTWCIGMFLPVLLVRDYGLAGFLIFALPNMIGAAAMGTVLKTPESSRRLVSGHAAACSAFSIVTILFHLFFVIWVVQGLIGPAAIWITALLTAAMFVASAGDRAARRVAVCVLGVSLFAFAIAYLRSNRADFAPFGNLKPTRDLLGLAAACTVGFALCPYLDLTFHRAREATASRSGAFAFAIGFLGLFPLMILFTLWYAPLMAPGRWPALSRTLAWVLAAHLMIQTALTVALHARSLIMQRAERAAVTGSAVGLVAVALLIAGFIALPLSSGPLTGETVYRLFMSFYALPFPAYVWICIVPLGGTPGALTRRGLITFLATVILAAPFFWLAFFGGRMTLLLPAVALLLLARFTLPRTASVEG